MIADVFNFKTATARKSTDLQAVVVFYASSPIFIKMRRSQEIKPQQIEIIFGIDESCKEEFR